MRFKRLETVVLDRDLPQHGLRKGALGAVVEVYEPDGLEVEIVTASGRTEALLTLEESDVRAVAEGDLVAVRPFGKKSARGVVRRPAAADGRPESERRALRAMPGPRLGGRPSGRTLEVCRDA